LKVLLLVVLAGLINAYVFLFCAVIVASSLPFWAYRFRKKLLTKKYVLSFLYISPIVSLTIVFLRSRALEAITRGNDELIAYGLRLKELVMPPVTNRLLPEVFPRLQPSSYHNSNLIETAQYLSYSVLFLGILGLFFYIKNAKTRFIGLWAISCLLVAVLTAQSQGITLVGISLPRPAALINSIAPFWRVYSRFGVVIMIFLTIFAALFINEVSRKLTRTLLPVLTLSLCVVGVIELWSPLPGRTTKFTKPNYVNFLQDTEFETIAIYPIVPDGHSFNYEINFWQRIHQKKLLNGGPLNSKPYQIQQALLNLNNPKLTDGLSFLGIDGLVVNNKVYRETYNVEINIQDKNLEKLYEDTDYTIFRVNRNAPPTLSYLSGDVAMSEIRSDGSTWRWIGKKATLQIEVSQARCYSINFNAPSAAGQKMQFNSLNEKNYVQGGYNITINRKLEVGSNIFQIITDDKVTVLPAPDGRSVTFYLSNIDVTPTTASKCS
jgi:hypothetical protein